jgi:hypothetical protein
MNKSWFNIKVKYSKPDEDGAEQKVTEEYLLDAYTYTEAETRMYQIIQDDLGSGSEVSSITKSNYAEVMRGEEGQAWWKSRITLISFDEESGKEKQTNQNILVQAEDIADAFNKLNKALGRGVTEFLIPNIAYTKILEVYEQAAPAEPEEGSKPRKSGLKPATSFDEE